MAITRLIDSRPVRSSRSLRTFLTAVWLGWQMETNWAGPKVFALYVLLRPIASVLILVVMYSVITDGALEQPIFAYIYLGNALYLIVGQLVSGVSNAVVEDRELYRMMKQLHTAPLNFYMYLLGRGVARAVVGFLSVVITIAFGMLLFPLPLNLTTIDWPLLVLSSAVGLTSIAALGVIIGAVNMVIPRHIGMLGDAVAGALYVVSGAIFPLDVLPSWLQPLGYAFPVTYWLEAARRALLGPDAARFPTLTSFSNMDLLGVLALSTIAMTGLSILVYRWAMASAKERGVLDMETSY
jgi:ABC-2 type transport system permease protein